jgi:heptosyltransferase I
LKIAIVKLSALGDLVHAMVGLQFIKAHCPEATIDWVVEEKFQEILAYQPDIHRILPVNLKALKKNPKGFWDECRKIKTYAGHSYDCVIDAQGLLKSAIISRLISENTWGFDVRSAREGVASFFYQNRLNYSYTANTIDRNVAMFCAPFGLTVSHESILQKKPFLFYQEPEVAFEFLGQSRQKHVLFVIGSTWESRNYPKQQYLEVINGLNVQSLIIWGSAQEKQDAEWIAERSCARVLPRLSLNDLKAVIGQVDLVIGNDTGPTHMAWGLNRPSITLFGPTPVSRVYQTPINRVLKSPSIVNPLKLDKQDFSIKEIQTGAIIEMAHSLLNDI